ncbi:MAG: (2Fe-2S)-binding protein [Planctomycetes bacterium]|nr:(2Fe-2S)-binding protein [Planctomycetota bacterium]
MDLDDKLCYCFGVSKRKIVNFVRQTRPRHASQVSDCFGAGTGCGWCIPFLVRIHRQVTAGETGEAVEKDELTPEEYEALRARYRQSVAEGARERNTYEACSSGPPSAAPVPADGEAPKAENAGEPFDFTRYFSRSRPEPEPEDLR